MAITDITINAIASSYLNLKYLDLKGHHEVSDRRIMCQSTPSVDQHQKSVEIRTLCQSTPFKLV